MRALKTCNGVATSHTITSGPALKAHGLHGQALCDVTTQATLVAQLLYACPAWSGFIKADEKAKLQSILNKTVRYGFLKNYKPVEYLFESSDTT